MKRVVLQKGKAWVEEVPMPKAENDWVVAKVHLTPICGSDKYGFLHAENPVRFMGHEGVGEIVDAGNSTLVKVGDRVILNPLSGCGTCDLCKSGDYIYCEHPPKNEEGSFDTHFAQYLKIKDFLCTPLPDDISYKVGTLAGCALSPAFRVLNKMNVTAYDTVLITGLGPVGLGATAIAKFKGARVIAVEKEEYRQNLGKELGADVVLDFNENLIRETIQEFTHGKGIKKAVDCSGNGTAERFCIDIVERGGKVGFIGENNGEIKISPSNDFIRKGLELMSAWHFNLNDFPKMEEILRRSEAAPKIITHEFGFSQVQEAFETFVSGKTGKVLLNPWK